MEHVNIFIKNLIRYNNTTFYINLNGRFGNILFNIALLIILKEKYPQHKIFLNISILKHYYPNDYSYLYLDF